MRSSSKYEWTADNLLHKQQSFWVLDESRFGCFVPAETVKRLLLTFGFKCVRIVGGGCLKLWVGYLSWTFVGVLPNDWPTQKPLLRKSCPHSARIGRRKRMAGAPTELTDFSLIILRNIDSKRTSRGMKHMVHNLHSYLFNIYIHYKYMI